MSIISSLIKLINEALDLHNPELKQKIEKQSRGLVKKGIKGFTTLLTYYISKVAVVRREVTFEYGKMLPKGKELVVGVRIPKSLENFDDLVEIVIIISSIFEEKHVEYGGDPLSVVYYETSSEWIGGLGYE